jgi:hypothetical protein
LLGTVDAGQHRSPSGRDSCLDRSSRTEAEWSLVEQDLNLAWIAVLEGLMREARRLCLLGEVLAVLDRVGAEVARISPAHTASGWRERAASSRTRSASTRAATMTRSG